MRMVAERQDGPGGLSDGRLPHLPALDGLRGICVAAVLGFHGQLAWSAGGYLGVSTFFTLSGFLITALLLIEHRANGHISLKRFWERRARRLLPALLVLVGIVIPLYAAFAAPDGQARLRGDSLATLVYGANWRFLLSHDAYADVFREPSPLLHAWSLAIEEQFYLVFPLVTLVLLRRRRVAYATAVACGILASAGIAVVADLDPDRVYFGTDTRAAELLVGSLLACLVVGTPVLGHRHARRSVAAIGAVALPIVLYAWASVDQSAPGIHRGGLGLYALGSAALVAACLVPGPLATVLAARPLRALGRISYGAYLYHWPLFLWLSPQRTGLEGWGLFLVRIVATLALASISAVWIERPVRDRRVLRSPPSLLVLPALSTLALVPIVAAGGERGEPTVVLAPRTAPTIAPVVHAAATTVQDAPRVDAVVPPVVLVVGDSVAITLGRGLEQWATLTGQAVVVNRGVIGCTLARGGEFIVEGRREEVRNDCNDWERSFRAEVERIRPDLVVVLAGTWDVNDRKLPHWDDFLAPGDPTFDAWLVDEYVRAADVLGSTGARVVWLTTPCTGLRQAPGLPERSGGTFDQRRIAHLDQWSLPAVAQARPGVTLVDLRTRVCDGDQPIQEIGPVAGIRPDGVHFSDAGSLLLAGELGPLLVDLTLTPVEPGAILPWPAE